MSTKPVYKLNHGPFVYRPVLFKPEEDKNSVFLHKNETRIPYNTGFIFLNKDIPLSLD
jgi:hypothetical protein